MAHIQRRLAFVAVSCLYVLFVVFCFYVLSGPLTLRQCCCLTGVNVFVFVPFRHWVEMVAFYVVSVVLVRDRSASLQWLCRVCARCDGVI